MTAMRACKAFKLGTGVLNIRKLIAIASSTVLITLSACQNSEKTRRNKSIEVKTFTNKVNEAIFAKDVNFIIDNWNPQAAKPDLSLLEHSFRQFDPELSSLNTKFKRGFSKETGKVVQTTNLYETLSSFGKATVTISVSHLGKDKCCVIENMNLQYKIHKTHPAVKEANESGTARRQFNIELNKAIFEKNTDFILKHWSPHARPISEDTLILMLNSIADEFSPGDMFTKEKQAEIFADRIVRHTQLSATGDNGKLYINLSTSALGEIYCCYIEALGITSIQNPNK